MQFWKGQKSRITIINNAKISNASLSTENVLYTRISFEIKCCDATFLEILLWHFFWKSENVLWLGKRSPTLTIDFDFSKCHQSTISQISRKVFISDPKRLIRTPFIRFLFGIMYFWSFEVLYLNESAQIMLSAEKFVEIHVFEDFINISSISNIAIKDNA